MAKLQQDFDTTSAAICKLFDKAQTKFAARKGSTFLYFKFVRQNYSEGSLYAYTKDCREMSVLVDANQMRSFLAAPIRLRGQAFGKLFSQTKKLERQVLDTDPVETVSHVYDLNKVIDFPMPKSSQYAKFSIQARRNFGRGLSVINFTDCSFMLAVLKRNGAATKQAITATQLATLIEHYAKAGELDCPDADHILKALLYA